MISRKWGCCGSIRPPNKARTFVPTVAGRQSAAELLSVDLATTLPSTPAAQRAASTLRSDALANPTALLSWAHDTATWQTTLVEFAVLLRRYGVDAGIDLFELHNPNVNWSTWGPDAMERSEFVLLAVNAVSTSPRPTKLEEFGSITGSEEPLPPRHFVVAATL